MCPSIKHAIAMRLERRLLRCAFTLLELLIAIVIIGVLAALLLPTIQNARESARSVSCKNNLRQIGIALLNYESVNAAFPIGAKSHRSLTFPPVSFGTSWWVDLLPHLEQSTVYDRFDRRSPHHGWALLHLENGRLIDGLQLKSMHCPSSPLEPLRLVGNFQLMMPSYVGIAGATNHDGFSESRVSKCCTPLVDGQIGAGGVLIPNLSISSKQITDGASYTIIVGEASDYASNEQGTAFRIDGGFLPGWIMGTTVIGTPPDYSYPYPSWNITTIRYPINTRKYDLPGIYHDHGANNPLVSPHVGGLNVLHAAGAVRFVKETLDVGTLKSLATRDDQ